MKSLGNQGPPDGATYRGRGLIQLTGRSNYETFGDELDIPLIENPELANDSKIAARLLARFIKSKEIAIKDALFEGDLKTVRKLVNGGSHGLDEFIDAFRTGDVVISEVVS